MKKINNPASLIISSLMICTAILTVSTATWAQTAPRQKALTQSRSKTLTQYVNPRIGTGGHGHVFIGANVPFGFVQLGPTENNQGWDWCSGYNACDSVIIGFSHTHLSGTGVGDLGDIMMFPTTGSSSSATFLHRQETSRPGYYSVILKESGIKAELTATARVGLHRYTYPAGSKACVILNLNHGIGWDKTVDAHYQQEDSHTISGYRISSGWAKHQEIYFTAQFSAPIQTDSDRITARLADGQPLLIKVAVSPVSIDNAKTDMKAELPGWDFEKTAAAADAAWNRQLGKIEYTTKSDDDMTIFYTSLYHTMIAPSIFCDVNGDYYGADGKVHKHGEFVNYTTFSLWDTYRAAHPLSTLIHREIQSDYAQTFIHIFAQQGKLPVWHLMGNETDCMVGNPAIPVLADMYLKGVKMDADKAYDAMKSSAMLDERGLKQLKQYGFLPYDKTQGNETIGRGLEYALADWCVAQVAKKMDKKAGYEYFLKRSKSYAKYFDKSSGFMRAVTADGVFGKPFSYATATQQTEDYTEGNAWQYAWLVPHDVHGLISLFGGEKPFISKLDSLFIVKGELGKNAAPDISGLIGQYAHGNEPSHHILYMYAYAGMPWKSAPLIRQTMKTLYTAAADGLSGNEDVGQMSAWYVLSALGLYQVEPAGGKYIFGSPLADQATLNVGDGKIFRIIVHNNGEGNIYIQSVKLNGKKYTRSYILYHDIIAGSTLEFYMGGKPSTFGTAQNDRP